MKALLCKPDGTFVKFMEVRGEYPTLYTLTPFVEGVEESLWDEGEHLSPPEVQTFILEWSNGQFALYVEGDKG